MSSHNRTWPALDVAGLPPAAGLAAVPPTGGIMARPPLLLPVGAEEAGLGP